MLNKCSIIKRSTGQNVYVHDVNNYIVTTHTANTHSSHCTLPTMVYEVSLRLPSFIKIH